MSQSSKPGQLPPDASARMAWLARLVGAGSQQAVAGLAEERARMHPACLAARMVWRYLAPAGGGAWQVLDDRLVMPLGIDLDAALHIWLQPGASAAEVAATLAGDLALAGCQLRLVLELAELKDSHRQLARSENLQRALFAISDLAGADLDMAELLRGIHAIVGMLMYAENFYIVRYDAERESVRFLYFADVADPTDYTGRELSLRDIAGTPTAHLLTTGQSLMGNAEELAAQVDGSLQPVGPDSDHWLGVPMQREGRVQGALVVQSYQSGMRYTEEDRSLLVFVGSHILTALERRQSKDELEQRVRQRTEELAAANRELRQEVRERERAERLQQALFQLAELATADIDENAFYERVHEVVGRLLDASNFFIALLSEDRRRLEFPYYIDAGVRQTLSLPLAGLSEYVLRRGEPWLGRRADIEALYASGAAVPQSFGAPANCWLGVPLRVHKEVIGLVVVQTYGEDAGYGPADQELLGFAALQIANSIYRRRSAAALRQSNLELERRVAERTRELREEIARREHIQQQLRHQVLHDPLTGLPNRALLRERLEAVLDRARHEPGRRCALLYLDVDRFKVINDSLGHLAGDGFLKAVAIRLAQCVRAPDLVARLSGDEFAILIEQVESLDTVQQVARRVLEALARPLELAGRELEPSASLGIAVSDEGHLYADALLRDADVALYRAKELGRKRYVLFDDTLARNAEDELALEGELRRALHQGELLPHFQPVRRLDDGAIVGYEALLRWQHPVRGLLVPEDFMRVALDSGQIEAIDWHLFARACEQFARLGPEHGFLSINVAPLHLRQTDFDRRLLALLERSGLSPSRLTIEVTEGALLDDTGRVRAILERLHAAGVGAALDDFGTGYSSLSYLHTLPLRRLKIDRAFVQPLDRDAPASSRAVVTAILAMAGALGIEVIAEGIETAGQREALVAMGCHFGQGYLLGRPAPLPPGDAAAEPPAG
ncbi:bifunctional diguanylate cyclase/phosphodiesterase [Aerosticca soli]|uniref:Diguanylate cyclase n=1 Tax=Aerosticca soli TaxID=2010829 RepID=A0A2Z6E7T4_9GAMM|nr:diguanylate cyclase [Aerosticca soli]